ncbi:SDR family NAD(P)-dependent oxidoreductase [Aurantiacibacter sp. MUD11]|nr:SDR family oxidoreductase [Aurantiacibacter sp. MUD11]WAT19305.1 SDR family NAD(P)-dependent oxidoreductase [Aurantiacibacter sp. MUD11]
MSHSHGKPISGCSAIVVGAGAIGTSIAEALLDRGASVMLLDRDEARLSACSSSISNEGLTVNRIDVGDADAVEGLSVASCDILVFAFGVQSEVNGMAETEDHWRQALETNVAGPARLARKIVPVMAAGGGGSITFVSSIHAHLPSRWASYSASKAAQEAQMREWAVDLAQHAIRVNAVAPGWVSAEERKSRLALLHQRTIPPEYIANAVCFLADETQSAFTTGSVLTIDAGASLYSGRVPFDPPDTAR